MYMVYWQRLTNDNATTIATHASSIKASRLRSSIVHTRRPRELAGRTWLLQSKIWCRLYKIRTFIASLWRSNTTLPSGLVCISEEFDAESTGNSLIPWFLTTVCSHEILTLCVFDIRAGNNVHICVLQTSGPSP